MKDLSDLPEPDRVEGAPHPRETLQLFGQNAAEQDFLEAFNSGRLHHGWLLTGPRGIGKATLAWRIARFLLATPEAQGDGLFGAPPKPGTLDIAPDHPVAHRIAALSEPGLFLLRRGPTDKGDRLAADIRVDEVRKLKGFFSLSAADGGRRVVIVDSADELNTASANAILKLLEEPPARTVMLLVSHQPARLLPTIRSRCRELRLATLPPSDLAAALDQADNTPDPAHVTALTELADGRVGEAIRLMQMDGLTLYHQIATLLGAGPKMDRGALLSLSDSCAGAAKIDRFDLTLSMVDQCAARAARMGASGQPPHAEVFAGEAALLAQRAPNAAAARELAQTLQEAGDRARHARAVNVDAASTITDLFLNLARSAS